MMNVGDVSMFENEHVKRNMLVYKDQKVVLKEFCETNLFYRVLMYTEGLLE